MGRWEGYLVAFFGAIGGRSAWTLRAEPVLLSLVVVWLTWKLAAALAGAAQLPSLDKSGTYARLAFMTVAASIAAIPPLYDGILELRTYVGFIPPFIILLLLLPPSPLFPPLYPPPPSRPSPPPPYPRL